MDERGPDLVVPGVPRPSLVGLVPALLATRPAVWPALRAGVAAEIGGQLRVRRVLVTAQLALSLVLVTASGLFGRTVYNLRHTDTGFQTDRLAQFQLNPGAAGYDRRRSEALFGQALDAIRVLPGVDAATLAVAPVLDNGLIGFALDVDGYSSRDGGRAHANANAVAPGYFPMVGTPLVRGRTASPLECSQLVEMCVVVRDVEAVCLRTRKDEEICQRDGHAGCATTIGELNRPIPDVRRDRVVGK